MPIQEVPIRVALNIVRSLLGYIYSICMSHVSSLLNRLQYCVQHVGLVSRSYPFMSWSVQPNAAISLFCS